MKKLSYISAVIWLLLGLCGASFAQQAGPLTSMDFTIMGVGLNASPEYQAVPKGIASRVDTAWTSGGAALPTEIVQQLPSGFVVKAELTGPAYSSPLYLTTLPGQPFDLPTLPLLGKYTLSNIRVYDSTGTVLFGAAPQAVTIESIKDPLITSVTTRQLTVQELQDRGVVFDNTNFTAYEFTAAIATESGQVPVKFPVLIPDSYTIEKENEYKNPELGLALPSFNSVPPQPDDLGLPKNIAISPFKMEADAPGVTLPPIPGIVVIPGNIGFLHQYFSALVMVTNGAPGQSDLIVKDLRATIILPAGEDRAAGTDADPGDDPLRMARGAEGYFPRIMDVLHAGPDGKYGTSDDISRLYPAETGQSDFTIEGLKEGTHKIDFEITATLEGLPIGPVVIKGRATGAVLVRNPDFTVTLGHPATVRSGEEYDLFVTITNTSKSVANLVSVHLDPRALSGAVFVPGEDPDKQIETILPGSSETIKYRLLSQRTGKVTATAFASEDVKGRFILRMGVGELGIPLSPDSLIIPYTGELAPDLVTAAVGLLGQAWSVATAPAGALPADVLPIAKQTITSRANDLSEAGLRILMGDQRIKAVQDLAFDFLGSDNANRGFDDLRRRSTQGLNLNRALAAEFQATIASSDVFTFQANYGLQASYRPGHVSVITSEAPVRVMVSDASGNRIGGLAAGEAFREIPYSDQLILSATEGTEITERSTLSLITKIESASYRVEIAAEAPGLFDLGVAVPDAAGTLKQIRFSNVPVLTGSKGRVTLLPGTATTYVLTFDDNGDGNPDRTVNPSSSLVIPDVEPDVVAATQIVPGFGPGGDKHGRTVAVLFSERVTRETAQNLANYSVEENALRIANLQPSGRMVFLLLRDGIGPFFGENGADGNFYGRRITVSSLTDGAGNTMASGRTLPIRITAQGPAAVVQGTVRTAKGEPVTGATIRLYQLVWVDDGISLEEKYALFSEKPVNSDGTYRFDYVFQNDDPAGPFKIEAVHPQTNEAASLITSVVFHGQVMNLDLFMKARGTVTGRVLDASGNPVPNTRVLLTALSDGRSYTSSSDAAGVFSFVNVPVGPFGLKAANQALYSEGATMGIIPDDGGTVTQDVTIYNAGTVQKGNVAGKVYGPDGSTPRPGVVVIVRSLNYANWMRTAADGSYSFTGVFAGTVTVEAKDEATGEFTTSSGSLADGQTITLNVFFRGLGTVAGSVLRDDGGSTAGYIVTAGAKMTTSDASGAFTLQNVPVGQVSVEVLHPQTYAQLNQGTVTLLTAGGTAHITLGIPAASLARGTIRGTVYRRDGTVQPLGEVRIVDLRNEAFYPYKADASGNYVLSDLPMGTYNLASVNGADVANATTTLWHDGQVKVVDFHPIMGTVTGTIYDTAGVNPDGTPAFMPVGADVSLLSLRPDRLGWLRFGGENNVPITVKSDPQSGRFTFTGVYGGSFTVTASNVFRPAPVSGSGAITTNGQIATIDLVLRDTFGSISGAVVQPDGTTPAGEGVRVTVRYGGADVTVTTDAQGGFQFRPVIPAGGYQVIALDQVSTLKGMAYVSVPAGGDVPVTIRLLGRGTVTVQALYADGTPASGASVDVKGADFPNDYANGTIRSDGQADGTAVFSNLSEGRYAVTVAGTYGRSGRAEGTISADGASVTVNVTLSATGTVTGKFLAADGTTPVPSGQITLLNVYNQVLAYTTTSSDAANAGIFTLSYVPLGDFKLNGFDPVTGRMGVGAGRVASQGQTVTADVLVIARGTVKGTVLNNTGTAPVDRAHVSISVSGVQGWSYQTITAPDGSFLFAGVPSGTFEIRVSDPATGLGGYASGRLAYEGETVRTEVRLQPSGAIEGVVLGPDGITPARNVGLCLNTMNCADRLLVDQNGRYRFENLAAGRSYTVYAQETGTLRAGRNSAAITSEGQVAVANVQLSGIGRVTGTVFEPDGQTALQGAKVTVSVIGMVNVEYAYYTGQENTPPGSFEFANVPAGTYTLRATHPQRLTAASVSGTLTSEGQVIVNNLVLGSVGTITGTVLMPDAVTPATAGAVKFTGCNRTYVAVIDGTGLFAFESIPLCQSFALYMEDATGAAIGYVSGSLANNGETVNIGAIILDDRAISVTGVTPPAGSVNVLVDTGVSVFFSEPARASTVNTDTVYLMQGNTKVAASLALSGDGRSVAIAPSQNLTGFTLYTVVVSGVEDLVYRKLGQTFTSAFTTIDSIPPTVTAVSPVNGATQIPLDSVVRVTFSESIDPASISGIGLSVNNAPVTIQTDLAQANTVAILSPLSPLTPNATYAVTVSGVKDTVGNTMAAPFTPTFATIDTIAPQVTSLTYPANADLIKGNTIPVTAAVDSTDTAFIDFFVNGQFAFTDMTAPFVYNTPLTTVGTVTVKAVAQDRAGNRNSNDPWAKQLSFTVNENQPPTVAITAPTNNSYVSTGKQFSVTVQATDDLAIAEYTLTASGIITSTQKQTCSAKTCSNNFWLTAPQNAAPGSTLTLTAVAKDSVGNVSGQTEITLTVRDETAPVVTSIISPGQTVRYKPGETGAATITATDNIGVTSVTCTATGAAAGSSAFTVEPLSTSTAQDFTFQVSASATPHASMTLSCSAKDAAQNTSTVKTLTLYVADIVPPAVSSTNVPGGPDNVQARPTLSVTFNESLVSNTVSADSVYLTTDDGSNTTVPGTVSLINDRTTVEFTPAQDIVRATAHKLTITTAATDDSNNHLAADYSLRFITDSTAPAVTTITPANGARDVALGNAVVIRFAEAVNPATMTADRIIVSSSTGSVAGAITLSVNNSVVTFAPSAPLAFSTDYTVTIKPGIEDVMGNATTADYVSTFRTGSYSEQLRVVYYDTAYPTNWASRAEALIYRNFLVANGFTAVNADELKTFMQSNGVGSVIVMANDTAPDTVANEKSTNAIFRKYLDAGGTVVWMQDNVLHWQGLANGTSVAWGESGMQTVLGIVPGSWWIYDAVTITRDGAILGLSQTWLSAIPVQPSTVTKVYASSSGGAAAWFKNFNSAYPDTGLIRIWDYPGDFTTRTYLEDLITILGLNKGDVKYTELVAQYQMDGNWTDASGNGFNGAQVNNPGFDSVNKFAGTHAGDFNGVNQYVNVGNLCGSFPDNAFSIEAWVQPDNTGGGGRKTIAGAPSSWSDYLIGLYKNQLVVSVGNGSTDGLYFAYSGFTPKTDGTWYHVVGTYDGSRLKLYVDGQLKDDVSAVWKQANNSGMQFWIGGEVCCNTGYFDGRVDDLAIYRRPLSADDILEHYNAGISDDRMPPFPPSVNDVSSPTYENVITLSGKKDSDASVRVNGAQIAGIDGSTDWFATYTLQLGQNVLHFTSRDAAGNESPEVTKTVELAPAIGQDQDIIGLWHFDGNWKDFSGNGNHGVPHNGPWLSTDAKAGTNAASFDGVDDRVTIQDASVFQAMNYITIEAWIKPGRILLPGSFENSRQTIVSFKEGDNPNIGAVLALPEDAPNRVRFWVKINNEWHAATSTTTINANTWYHVVGTYDGSTIRVYVNGMAAGQKAVAGTMMNGVGSATSTITLGARASNNVNWFQGLIDDVVIYRRALVPEEIRAHYNGLAGGNVPAAPAINPVTPTTLNNIITLTGTKDPGTSIWINGVLIVPADGSTAWSSEYSLQPGVNTLQISSRDSAGSLSDPTTVTIEVLPANQKDPDIVGLWHFDDSWADYSGNNNHGTPYNGATFSSTRRVGSSSGAFDGAGDYAWVKSSALIANSPQSSVGAWVYPTAVDCRPGDYGRIIYSENVTGGVVFELGISCHGTPYLAVWRSDVPGNWIVAESKQFLSPNTWYHIIGTLDASGMKIYVNGILSGSNTHNLPSNGIITEVNTGRITNDGGRDFFSGLIDELIVYRRSLPPEDILEQYTSGISGDRISPAPPTVDPVASPTASSTITLSGTKETDSSIRINGRQVVLHDVSATWQAAYSLQQVGDNVLTITSRDAAGNESPPVTVTVTLLPANQYESSLMGLWHMDGSWHDYSGNGNHGTPVNGASFSTYGIVGSHAGMFDGFDDHTSIPNSTSLHSSRNLTITGWIYTNRLDKEWQAIYWKGNTPDCVTGCDNREYSLWLNSAGYLVLASTPDHRIGIGQLLVETPQGAVQAGKWYYVTAVISADLGVMKIYIDGVERASAPYSSSNIRTTTGPLIMGNSPYPGINTSFNGRVDELAIYGRAFAASEAFQHYTATKDARLRPAQPTVGGYVSPTYDNMARLTGMKPANTSIWINGIQVVPGDASSTWQVEYALNPGQNSLSLTSRDFADNESYSVNATIDVLASKLSDPDIAGLWHFDGNWMDYSGNGNHLSPLNGASFVREAQSGTHAGAFISAARSYARRASGTGLPLGNSPRTFAAWIKPYSYPDGGYNGIFAYGPMACTGYGSLLSIKSDGRPSMAFWCNDAYQTIGPSVALNEWNHVAFTYDGGTKIRFYMNGRFIQEQTVASVPNTLDGPVRIGSTDDPGRTFDGLIDEAVIYKRALTDLEMEQLYNQGAGRVGVWHMENTWDDASGNGNHGTAVGSAAFQADARAGSTAGSFDGADGYVVGAAAKLPAGNAARTVSAWVKAPSGNQDRAIFEYGTGSGAVSAGDFRLYIDGSNLAAVGTGFGSNTFRSTTRLDDGRWHHVVGVYEGSVTNTVRIYVDGVPENSGTISPPETVVANFSIGAFLGSGGNFNGLLDEVVVYNHALKAEEVNRQFNSDMGRVAYWKLDGNGSDSSGNDNQLTPLNGAWFSTDAKVGSNAAQFNGSNSYLRRATENSVPLGNTPRTLMAWIKPFSYPDSSYNGIISYGATSLNNRTTLSVRNNGQLSMSFEWNDAWQTVGSPVVQDDWNHVVFTYDGGKKITFYINGQFVQEQDVPSIPNTLDGAIRIGSTDDPGRVFNGLIDEAEIYSRALTTEDIRDRYNAMIGSVQPPSAPGVNPVASTTYDNTISLSGTKQAGTSVWINGVKVVPADDSTSWYTTYSLPPGTSTLYVSTRDSSGSLSEPVPVIVNVLPVNQQDPDLVGLWHMDGNWMDYSGNGNNGVIADSPGFTSDKIMGTLAGKFDGISDGVYVSDSTNKLAPSTLTVESWFKSDDKFDAGASVMILYKGVYDPYPNMAYSLEVIKSTGKLHGRSDTAGVSVTSSTSVADNAWHHAVFIVDNATNEAILYLDGVLQGAQTFTGVIKQTTEPLAIGKYYANNDYDFSGLIDEVAIYKRALTAEEIEQSYNAGIGRVAVWHTDNTWNDSSENQSNGTAYGNPVFAASSRAGSTVASLDGLDDYVSGDASKLPGGFAPRAISAWVKIGNGGRKQSILNYGAATQGDFALYIDDMNKAALSSGSDVVAGTTSLADGRWHFITAVYEGPSTNLVKVYVDGLLEGMGVITTPSTAAGDYTIGRFLDGTGYFNGQLDELIVYDYAITEDDINKYYNQDMGRVAYWKMENNWQDSSGNNKNLTASGAAFSADSKVWAGAAKFDGVDDYADAGTWFNYQTFSIAMWVNPGATQVQYADIIDNNHTDYRSWVLQQNSTNTNQYYWALKDNSASTPYLNGVSFSLPPNKWTHIAITRDGNTRENIVYINGSPLPTFIGTGAVIYDGTQFFRLSRWGGGGRNWNGLMDDVAVYNRALAPDEVMQQYQSAVASP